MSYQHFYSRVPARVSLFNKRDGFDTFAHTSGLNPEFIRGELSCVYEGKLAVQDQLRVMRGEIPPVYSQILLPSGALVHSVTSYIPSDFTGERSAYLTHTHLLTEAEREAVMCSTKSDCFNRHNFITDIKRFNLTSASAAANSAYPMADYLPRPISDHKLTVSSYNPEMMKSFIYAILKALLEGGKDVYFRLPLADSHASRAALSLMNAVMSILPYGIREKLSFVSLIGDVDAYPEFKVKCVGSDVRDVPEEKGVFFDFAAGRHNARYKDYERNYATASFLYSLFGYSQIREEFLPFMHRVEKRYPDLTLGISSLCDLVFLFWQCSGFYVEGSVVPDDDSLCRLLDVYSGYREGLIVEHRVRAYSPLKKYPASHTAIPDSVFSRVSRLYPADCVEAKEAALEVLLKLIHVDLMRDSLFCFITRYYGTEIPRIKALINENLARVFYGGFLQQGILVFFDTHFRAEPTETKDVILDKLLLSVRTPEIQRQVMLFLDRHYPALNDQQKTRICQTCLEMLPECDGLAVMFTALLNRRVSRDNGNLVAAMSKRLTDMLAAFLSKGDGRLAAIFADNNGYCEQLLLSYVLSSGVGVDILASILASMPAHKRGDKLLRAYKLAKNLQIYMDLITRIAYMPVVVAPSELKDVLELDRLATLNLPSDMLYAFRERIIYPVIGYTLADVFKPGYGKEGFDKLLKYAEANPAVAGSPAYKLILDFLTLVHKCSLGETEGAFKTALLLPEVAEIRANIGEFIRQHHLDTENQDDETTCTYMLVINYLTKGNFDFDSLYADYAAKYKEAMEEKGIIGGFDSERRAAAASAELIISRASEVCDAARVLCALAAGVESGLRKALSEFISTYGLGAGLFLKKQTKETNPEIEEMAEELIEERNASIQSPTDAIDLILRRK